MFKWIALLLLNFSELIQPNLKKRNFTQSNQEGKLTTMDSESSAAEADNHKDYMPL